MVGRLEDVDEGNDVGMGDVTKDFDFGEEVGLELSFQLGMLDCLDGQQRTVVLKVVLAQALMHLSRTLATIVQKAMCLTSHYAPGGLTGWTALYTVAKLPLPMDSRRLYFPTKTSLLLAPRLEEEGKDDWFVAMVDPRDGPGGPSGRWIWGGRGATVSLPS